MSAPGPAGDAKQADVATTTAAESRTTGPQEAPARAGAHGAKRLRTVLVSLARHPRYWVLAVVVVGSVGGGFALAAPHLRAWYHFRAAKAALQSYHNPQAIRALKECMRVWPDDPDVLLLSARAARRARAYDDAERCLEKYKQARGLDDACSLEQLLLSAELDVDQVADVCRHHVEKGHPDTPLILEALARGYLRKYRIAEARFCLDRWLQDQPDNPQALCLDGEIYLDYEHAPDRAARSYRRALALDPEHEDAHMGLAIVQLETKSYSEAAEHLEYLQRCQLDNLRVPVGLAECRYGLGERAEAVRLVDDVLARQAEYAPALSMRGRLELDNEQYRQAEKWLRKAVRRAPSDHEARYSLILCLYKNGKAEEAKRHEQELKQWEDGVKQFDELVAKEMPKRPRDPNLHFELGQLLMHAGHQEEGLRWLHSALRLDPGNAPARNALTEYYEKARAEQQQPGD